VQAEQIMFMASKAAQAGSSPPFRLPLRQSESAPAPVPDERQMAPLARACSDPVHLNLDTVHGIVDNTSPDRLSVLAEVIIYEMYVLSHWHGLILPWCFSRCRCSAGQERVPRSLPREAQAEAKVRSSLMITPAYSSTKLFGGHIWDKGLQEDSNQTGCSEMLGSNRLAYYYGLFFIM
jgi:hypothetical protein